MKSKKLLEDKMNYKGTFQQEFKALLEKYNVSIGFQVSECSDTYGLSGEKMIVYHTIPNTYKTEDWIKVDGWDIGASDI
jgi:hypothetical protein